MPNNPIQRQFKSKLFPMVFSDKTALLSLYNAINGSSYTDPDDLTVTTLENATYMGIKNDMSFLLEDILCLYEHQSTWNPNMPLRGVFYFSNLYQGIIARYQMDIYSKTQLSLPTPQYIILYNGLESEPDRMVLKLSDSFSKKGSANAYVDPAPALECRATLLNIKLGHNPELMQKCRPLYEYAYLIESIRQHLDTVRQLPSAVDLAVEHCIQEGIMADFLRTHRAEVNQMILYEYNEELHIKSEKAISFKEGKQKGKQEGERRINTLNQYLIRDKRFSDLERAAADPEFQEKLCLEYGIG